MSVSPKEPIVSVIIPTFNRRAWIGECLDSVLRQSYQNVEVIVVDDVSTDDTVAWIADQPRYQNVRVHVQTQNGGASLARNKGIELSTGELIAFIDSDDMLMPEHIEKAVAAFQGCADLGLFCCDSRIIDAESNNLFDGMTWHEALGKAKGIEIKTGLRNIQSVLSYSNCFPGFTLRRDVFEELGAFDQSIFPADDYDLALRVAGSRFKVYYLNEPLCLRREHDGQLSGVQNSVKTQLQLIRAVENAATRNAKELNDPGLVRRRMAEMNMELGIIRWKEGDKLDALRLMLRSARGQPDQIAMLFRIGARKLKLSRS
jgi:glycosyltransferase involved in cell wall biosynthesis